MTPMNGNAVNQRTPNDTVTVQPLALRLLRYAALAATALGVVLTAITPQGEGPVIGFVGVVAVLALHWWKANA